VTKVIDLEAHDLPLIVERRSAEAFEALSERIRCDICYN
jgi:hypothetical protein